jgi:hypothetical protein
VYLSPEVAHSVSFPNLFAHLCRLLPADIAQQLEQRYRDPWDDAAAILEPDGDRRNHYLTRPRGASKITRLVSITHPITLHDHPSGW